MGRNVLIVDGHPDRAEARFCHALAKSYRAGAEAGGHRVETLHIADLDLPYLRAAADWKGPPVNAAIAEAQAAIGRAGHLVFVYPLWLGDMPAMLKSFFELVSCQGFVMAEEGGRWKPGLAGKSARIIVTMGMPALVYRLYFFSHSLKSLERNILRFAGVSPVRSSLVGSVESSAEHRRHWLEKVHTLGRRGA